MAIYILKYRFHCSHCRIEFSTTEERDPVIMRLHPPGSKSGFSFSFLEKCVHNPKIKCNVNEEITSNVLRIICNSKVGSFKENV